MNVEIDSDEDIPLATVAKRNNIEESVDESVVYNEEKVDKVAEEQKDSLLKLENNLKKDAIEEPVALVDNLVEYQWPQNRSGEYHHILEQLVDFLGTNMEDEKLKELQKQEVSQAELGALKEKGILATLKNCTGVMSVKTEDAFEFMLENFPEKFKTYIKLVHQKEMRKLVRKQEAQRANKGKIPNIMKRSLKETVRYNSQLNQERLEERCAYFDLQTQIIHLPQKKRKYNPDNKPNKSHYPVALMPGQYQDYYKRYTSDELKYLPINTITAILTANEGTTAVVDEKRQQNEEAIDETEKEDEEEEIIDDVEMIANSPKSEKDPFCGICMKGPEMNKRGVPEKLIHCSQCENSGHPSCLDMNRHIVKVIQTYPWQCMECKICTECLAPHDEESMMFCDNCDRGYHSYCVGLKEIPKGRWVCDRCGKCSSCLGMNPVPDGGPGRWKNEVSKPLDGTDPEFLQIHCHPCSKLFRKGSFCPVCLKVYRDSEDHINPMVCCDICDRWVHTDCDGIDEHRYMELSKDRRTSYTCILCRGEKEERLDSFHRKYR